MEWIIKILRILPYIVVLLGIWSVVKKIRSGKSITSVIVTIVMTVVFTVLAIISPEVVTNMVSRPIDVVKNTTPASISEITYEQALEYSCSNTKWRWFNSDDRTMVEMTGTYNNGSGNQELVIQFRYPDVWTRGDVHIKDNEAVKVTFLGLGGQTQCSEEDIRETLFSMFCSYATKNGITVNEEQKDNIEVNKSYLDKHGTDNESKTEEE